MNISGAVEFCLDKAALERARNTARTYRKAAEIFLTFLEGNQIDVEDIEIENLPLDLFIRFPSWLLENYSRMTAGVYMAGVMYIWNWLLIQDWIKPTMNQTARLQKAIETARFDHGSRRVRTPKPGDLEKMVDAVRQMNEPSPRIERDIALVLFLASSGCRNSEATNLKIKDIDLAERTALIKNGKGDKDRLAFFSEAAATALREYWTARGFANKTDPAFARHDKGAGKRHGGITPGTVRNVIDNVTALAGVAKGQFTPHYFRHAFAIKALQETGNLALVQDLLGHASPVTTRVYAEIYEDDLKDAHHRIFK